MCVSFLKLLFILLVLMSSSCDAKDNPLNEARHLRAEGKWEQALQKHIWIHDHILEKRPASYGVRLSYALSEWVELGQQYPKALTALTEIRDKKTERLLNGELDRHLFDDVMAINRYLKQPAGTVNLFKKLESLWPDFAPNIYLIAEDSVLAAGEYALARKYLGDPMARLETARKNLREGLAYAKMSRIRDASRRTHENIFKDEIVGLITILKNTSEAALAKNLQKEALKTLDNSEIRNAL